MNQLFEAIERGDAGTVWQLAQAGAMLEEVDETTQLTPLALAAEAGQAEIVRTLLEAGADPDRGGATTPLEAAVVEGHGLVVEALLGASANVHQTVADGFTPLMTAAATGDLHLVRMLLAAGARPGQKNDQGETAVTLAEDGEHEAVVAELLTARRQRRRAPEPAAPEPAAPEPAAPEPAAPEPATPEPAVPEPVTDPETTMRRDENGEEMESEELPADEAVAAGTVAGEGPPDLERLRELVAAGRTGTKIRRLAAAGEIDLDGRDAEGRTALIVAAEEGDVALARALIAGGAETDADDPTDAGRTALVYAVRSPSGERHEIVSLLAAAGADLDRRCGRSERTPLMHAVEADVYLEREDPGGFAATTRQLIELGADLEARNGRGRTVWRMIKRDALGAPTFSASRRRLHQMLRLLENSGARKADSHKV